MQEPRADKMISPADRQQDARVGYLAEQKGEETMSIGV